MSRDEIRALEKIYGMKIKPRTKREIAQMEKQQQEREATMGTKLWR